jgi:hypothetical protein
VLAPQEQSGARRYPDTKAALLDREAIPYGFLPQVLRREARQALGLFEPPGPDA